MGKPFGFFKKISICLNYIFSKISNMTNNEQDILNAIELERELQEVSPSQHEIQDRMFQISLIH